PTLFRSGAGDQVRVLAVLAISGAAGEGDHPAHADLPGQPHGVAEVALVLLADRRVGVERVAVATQRADLQPPVIDLLLPLAEAVLVGEQFGGLAVGLAQLGDVAARADLDRLCAGAGDPVEGLVEREQVLKHETEHADLHGWLPPLVDPARMSDPAPLPGHGSDRPGEGQTSRSVAAARSG